MLNLTELLSQRPAPIKGARLVRGYAMSGCKEDTSAEVVEKVRKAVMHEDSVIAALVKYGPMRAILLADKAGIPETSLRSALKRLHGRGIVTQIWDNAWALSETLKV